MRTLVIVAVILHLVITVKTKFQFGDIISYPRKCPCIPTTIYKHYAVYVGNRNIKGKDSDQNIFHRKSFWISTDCVFDKLDAPGEPTLDNYEIENVKKSDDSEIVKRIEALHNNCDSYKLFTRNCENLATYVRYGISCSEQPDTLVSSYCKGITECPEWDDKCSHCPKSDR